MSSRGYSSSDITALNGNPELYRLVKLDFDTPLYLTTAPFDIEYDSQTWVSSAILSELPAVKESLAMKPNNISLKMAGSALSNQSLTFENYNNTEALFYRYLADTAETVQEYKGFIQTYKKSENIQSGKSVITWSIAGHWFDWGRRYGRIINDQEQQNLHPGDRFFEYYHLTAESISDWAEADPDFGGFIGGLVAGIGEAVGNIVVEAIDAADQFLGHFGIGGGSDDGEKAPKQNVDEHVGNAVDPESKIKRVPLAYGETRAKGIAIFRSLDPANKEYLYVVYLLSEGTIDGLTGNKLEFKNGEPYTSSRISPYCSLISEHDGSQTSADSTLLSVFGSSGTGTGYLLNDAASAAGDTVIKADTGTGTILVGDIVNFAGDTVNYSVSVALSAGQFEIAGAGLVAGLADNTAITIRSIWTSNHIGYGLAYNVVRYKKSPVWQGEPKPAHVLKGLHVYDHRTGTTGYSTSPALIVRDLFNNSTYGKNIPSAEIDDTTFNSVATLGETTNNDHGGEDGGSASAIDLFSFDGVLSTNTPLKDNIEKVLFNCRGHVTHVSGKYKIISEQTGETSVYSFNEDNITGNFEVSETPAAAQYNKVLYEIIAPDFNYKPWVETVNSSTYLTEDNNRVSHVIIKNIYERNRYRAKNRASTIMKRSREGIRVKLTASNADAMSIECGQIVDITRTSEGWTNKLFRVTSMTIGNDATCEFNLAEYESSVYDWSVSVEDTPPSDTTLPDNRTALPPTSLVLNESTAIGNDLSERKVIDGSFTASEDEYVENYRIEYKESTDSVYKILPLLGSSDTTFLIDPVKDDVTYNIRVYSINAQGTESTALTGTEVIDGLVDTVLTKMDFFGTTGFYERHNFYTLDGLETSGTTIDNYGVTITSTGSIENVARRVGYQETNLNFAKKVSINAHVTPSAYSGSDVGWVTCGYITTLSGDGFGLQLKWNTGTSKIDIYSYKNIASTQYVSTLITSVNNGTSLVLEATLDGTTLSSVVTHGGSEYTNTFTIATASTETPVYEFLLVPSNAVSSSAVLKSQEVSVRQSP